jgi:hypothetical protein
MVASLKLCDEGLLSFEGSFSGVHTFPTIFSKTDSAHSGPHISTEDTIQSKVGTIVALSTRLVKRYVLGGSGEPMLMPSWYASSATSGYSSSDFIS